MVQQIPKNNISISENYLVVVTLMTRGTVPLSQYPIITVVQSHLRDVNLEFTAMFKVTSEEGRERDRSVHSPHE